MAEELVSTRLRGSQVFKLQQRGQGCTQTEKGCWQHEDEALMDALELIHRRNFRFQPTLENPLTYAYTSVVLSERNNEHHVPLSGSCQQQRQ